MTAEHLDSQRDTGYFGVTFLHVDPSTAGLLAATVRTASKMDDYNWYDSAHSSYHFEANALTIEGVAVVKGAPDIAIRALSAYAVAARNKAEIDAVIAG